MAADESYHAFDNNKKGSCLKLFMLAVAERLFGGALASA